MEGAFQFLLELVPEHTHRVYVYLNDGDRYPFRSSLRIQKVERVGDDLVLAGCSFDSAIAKEEEVKAFFSTTFFRRYVQRIFFGKRLECRVTGGKDADGDGAEGKSADTAAEAALAALRKEAEALAIGSAARVIGYPKKRELSYCDAVTETGRLVLTPSSFDVVLYFAALEKKSFFFVGSSSSSPFQREMERPKGFISKAQFKMEEIVTALSLSRDDNDDNERETRSVLDLGAAPGGWSCVLSRAFPTATVVAVDAGELRETVRERGNVVHVRKTLTPSNAASLLSPFAPFDLVVCDVNVHPKEACGLLRPVLPFLRSGGRLCFTVKCVERRFRDNKAALIDLVKDFLLRGDERATAPPKTDEERAESDEGEGETEKGEKGVLSPTALFASLEVMWLVANTTHERTIVAVKK